MNQSFAPMKSHALQGFASGLFVCVSFFGLRVILPLHAPFLAQNRDARLLQSAPTLERYGVYKNVV